MRRYETIAQIFHGQASYRGGEPFPIRWLVERLNLRVSLLPIDILCANGAILPKLGLIGIATELSPAWARWVLAHEIGHLFSPRECDADAFAAELLLPRWCRDSRCYDLASRYRIPELVVDSICNGSFLELPLHQTEPMVA